MTSSAPDFSIYGLMMGSDPVVKGVLVLLVLASVACWAIIIEKLIRLLALSRAMAGLDQVAHGPAPTAVSGGLVGSVLAADERESAEARGDTSTQLRDRRERAMRMALKSELRRLEFGLPLLATVASAAPFIGLFGTVWGIVHSFAAIAQEKDTSLAVVAPGIAEALIATAIGLAAAIPAVVAYNLIGVSLARAYARGSSAILQLARRPVRLEPEPMRRSPEPMRAGVR